MKRPLAAVIALTLLVATPVLAQEAVERAEAEHLATTPLPFDARDEAREWRLWWDEADPSERPAMEAQRVTELEVATWKDRQLARYETDFDSLARTCPEGVTDVCRIDGAGVIIVPGDEEAGLPAHPLYWQQLRMGSEWDMPRAAVILYTPTADGRLKAATWVRTAIVHEPPVVIEGQGDLYVAVPGYHDGTGHANADVLFRWAPGAERPFTQIDITSWKDDLTSRLPTGLEVWKGVAYRWPYLMAETSLWQANDANCCASGGEAWIDFRIDGDRLAIEWLQVNDRVLQAAETTPADILAWAGRRVGCDHWAGEEPYDAKRAAMIAEATARLDCEGLDADQAALVETYAGDEVALALIERVAGAATREAERP